MEILDIVNIFKWIFRHSNIAILIILLANGIVLPIFFHPWGLIIGIVNLLFFGIGVVRAFTPDDK
jgi:hypothetical protein